jgi:hypothetical protein
MTSIATLQLLFAQGESETLELKRSTGALWRAGETLCAFLNGEGRVAGADDPYRITEAGRAALLTAMRR